MTFVHLTSGVRLWCWDGGEVGCWWWKNEMVVKSAWSEGEVLKNWLTIMKPCFMKNSTPLVFFTIYFIILSCFVWLKYFCKCIDLFFVRSYVPSLRVRALPKLELFRWDWVNLRWDIPLHGLQHEKFRNRISKYIKMHFILYHINIWNQIEFALFSRVDRSINFQDSTLLRIKGWKKFIKIDLKFL